MSAAPLVIREVVGGVLVRVVVERREDGSPLSVSLKLLGCPVGNQTQDFIDVTCQSISLGLEGGMPWSELDTYENRQDTLGRGETTDPFVPRASSLFDYLYKAVAARIGPEVLQ